MPTHDATADPIQRYLASVLDPAQEFADVFAEDAVLDATVPNWRFAARGAAAVRAELGRWFADPATFDAVTRTPISGGELVQFELTWVQDGTPYAVHQAHVLSAAGDRVTRDVAWCGGRWSASALAEMEAASLADA